MRLLCVAVAFVMLSGVARASEDLKKVAASYIEIQKQLAVDKIDAIKAPAAAIVKDAGAMGKGGADIVNAAKALEQAADLKKARDAFGSLSNAVIAAAKADGWKDLDGLKLAYCPMVGKSWLQKEELPRNPYYGSLMLECGDVKDPKK